MSLYNFGSYNLGLYGSAFEEVSNVAIINPGVGNQLNLSWTNPYPYGYATYGTGLYGYGFYGGTFLDLGSIIFYGTLTLRSTSPISDVPNNSTQYSVGNIIGSSTVVLIGDYLQNTFSDTGISDNVLYYYKIFTFNNVYSYSTGVQVSGTSIDIIAPLSVTNFKVQDLGISNTLYLSWTNPIPPATPDLAGIRIVRKIGSYPTTITDGTIVYSGTPISSFTDSPLINFIAYYYAIFAFDEVPWYSIPAYDHAIPNPLLKRFKYIKDRVSDFQSIVDKERVILYWAPIQRTLNFKALRVDSNSISLTAKVNIGDNLTPYSNFTSIDTGLSSTDNKYLNDELIFLSKYNIISRPKKILNYNGSTKMFTTENVEYEIEPLSIFGFKTVDLLIDDINIYMDTTLTTQDNSSYKVVSYDTSTKTFTTSGALSIVAGDKFDVTVAYYPKLYISKDKGITFDNGTNLIYTVSDNSIPTFLESKNYYNKFKVTISTLLNIADPKFYIGSYITFITGKNKGKSKKILAFNIDTKEFTTEYFNDIISQNDIFTINTYTIQRVANIQDYIFKIVLWNNDNNNPIYGEEVRTYPTVSLYNYTTTLDNGYWNTSLDTNFYKIIQGITKEAHSRSELETVLQKDDFGINTVRDNKLYQNFGINFNLSRNTNQSFQQYRERLEDTIIGFRNAGLYEGLNQLSGAFNNMPLHYEHLSTLGWRIGDKTRGGKRLGYKLDIITRSVLIGDLTPPYNTFTTYTSGASGTLSTATDYYKDSYVTFTSYLSGGSTFDQTLLGDFIPVSSYSASGGISTFTLANSGVGVNIPNGSDFLIISPNLNSGYNTLPYSSSAALFGVRIFVYGPFLDTTDKSKFEELVDRLIPAHVKKIISYETKFVGDSVHFQFEGDKTNLVNDYSINTLRPIKEQLLEPGRLVDTFTTSVSGILNSYNSFTGTNLTTKHNQYKGKSIKFLTGNNKNISSVVIDYIGGTYNFITKDFPYVIQIGDTFEIENIKYQTKYVTQIIDTTPDSFNVNYFDNKFVGSWFVGKQKTDIEEKTYIQFSDDMINYTIPRELTQNERLNEVKKFVVTVANNSSPYSTLTTATTGSINSLMRITDYYKNRSIKFTSGANLGISKKILSYNSDTLTFTIEAPNFPIIVNDTFQLLTTDMKRFAKMIIYHNNLSDSEDIEIEALVIKIK